MVDQERGDALAVLRGLQRFGVRSGWSRPTTARWRRCDARPEASATLNSSSSRSTSADSRIIPGRRRRCEPQIKSRGAKKEEVPITFREASTIAPETMARPLRFQGARSARARVGQGTSLRWPWSVEAGAPEVKAKIVRTRQQCGPSGPRTGGLTLARSLC